MMTKSDQPRPDAQTLASLAKSQWIRDYLEFSTGIETPDLLESAPVHRLDLEQKGDLRKLYDRSNSQKISNTLKTNPAKEPPKLLKTRVITKPKAWHSQHIETIQSLDTIEAFLDFLSQLPDCPLRHSTHQAPSIGEGEVKPEVLVMFEPSHDKIDSDPLFKLKADFLRALSKHRRLYHMESSFWPLANENLLSEDNRHANRLLLRRFCQILKPSSLFFVGSGAYELFEGHKPRLSQVIEDKNLMGDESPSLLWPH